MTNKNLTKAKELKEEYEEEYNSQVYLPGTDTFEGSNPEIVIEKIKKLKEKIEEMGKEITAYTNDTNYPIKRGLTDEEEEAIKICEDILK